MLSRYKITQRGSPSGYSPEECFVLIDSGGYKNCSYLCTDYEKLNLYLCGKQNINLQIKMWVETTIELPPILMPDEVYDITRQPPYRDWVFQSYIQKLRKLWVDKHGFVPMFIRRFSDFSDG